ncbi:hypothetical protein D3C75_526850 [compost metagenome]
MLILQRSLLPKELSQLIDLIPAVQGGKHISQMLERIKLVGFVQTLHIRLKLIGSMQILVLDLTQPDHKQPVPAKRQTFGMLEPFTLGDTLIHEGGSG